MAPRVPRTNLDRVPLRPLPGVRAAAVPEIGGEAEVFEAARGVVREAQAIAAQEKARGLRITTNQYRGDAGRFSTSLWTEAQGRRSGNAVNVAVEMNERYQEWHRNRVKGITDTRTREAVEEMFTSSSGKLNGRLQQYELGQAQSHEDSTFKAMQNGLAEVALSFADDPDRSNKVMEILDEHRKKLDVFTRSQGLSVGDFVRREKIFDSTVHSGIIRTLLAKGKDIAAKDYLHLHGREMTADDRRRAGLDVEEGGTRGTSQRLAENVMSQDTPEKPLTDEAALVMARAASTNPKVNDLVVARVRQRLRDRAIFRRDELAKRYEGFAKLIDDNPGRNPRDLIPANIWNNETLLPAKVRDALIARAVDPPIDDHEAWIDFRFRAKEDPRSISEMNRQEFETDIWIKLSGRHREQALAQWSAFQDAKTKPGKPFVSLFSDEAMILRSLADAQLGGITRSDTKERVLRSSSKSKVFTKWMDRIDENRAVFNAQNKRDPNDAELQKIIDEEIIPETMIDVPRGDDKPIKELKPLEIIRLTGNFEKVPARAVERLVEEAKRLGIALDITREDHRLRITRAYLTSWVSGSVDLVHDTLTGKR